MLNGNFVKYKLYFYCFNTICKTSDAFKISFVKEKLNPILNRRFKFRCK